MKKLLLGIILLHLILLLSIDFFPYPELFVYPYLTSQGLLPYKQVFDQHFPGLMFFPVNLYTLGFTLPQHMQAIQLALVAISHILIWKLATSLLRKNQFIPNLMYLFWQPFFEGYVLWIDSFMPVFLLGSYVFLVSYLKNREVKQVFLAGLTLGVALVFKQVVVVIIGFIFLFLLLNHKKKADLVVFALGTSIPVLIMLVYIYTLGVWDEFVYWTLTFNVTTFSDMGRKYATLVELLKVSPVFGAAVIASLFASRLKNRQNLLLIGLFASSLVFAYARFDFVHLQPALPFALLLLAAGYNTITRYKLVVPLVFVSLSALLIINFYINHIGRKVHFYGSDEVALARKVQSYANKGDSIFALATMPHLYSMTHTLPPGKVFVFHFPWFMRVTEETILTGLINDPPAVVVRDISATTDGMSLLSYMRKIDNYIMEGYYLLSQDGNYEFWLKR